MANGTSQKLVWWIVGSLFSIVILSAAGWANDMGRRMGKLEDTLREDIRSLSSAMTDLRERVAELTAIVKLAQRHEPK